MKDRMVKQIYHELQLCWENKCGKCLEFKPLEEFKDNQKRRDGSCRLCISCQKLHEIELTRAKYIRNRKKYKEYYVNNKESHRIRAKAWRKRNIQHLKDYGKEYYTNNKERMIKCHSLWNKNNKKKVKTYNIKYYLENKEAIKKIQKQYHVKNRERILKVKRKYYHDNKKLSNS